MSSANYAGFANINILLMLAGLLSFIERCQVNYLNNRVEHDHHFIKKITKPMMGFKAFHSAEATIDGNRSHDSKEAAFRRKYTSL